MRSLACNNINTHIPLSSWVVHLLFVFCRFRWLCVHSRRWTCGVWLGFDTSSFISSIPREAAMSVSYLWSPFPLAAPCHFLAGFVCVCEGTAGKGWWLPFFSYIYAACVHRSCQGACRALGRHEERYRSVTSNSSRHKNNLLSLNLVISGGLDV